jgi:Ser/Thr protein kinase RdoA (MazF antagonist)
MTAPPTLEQVVELLHRLGVDGENTRLHLLGRGHIHETYLVECAQQFVVLQRLNRRVFPDLEKLVANADRVSTWLTDQRRHGNYHLDVPRQLRDGEGRCLIRAFGAMWRAIEHVSGTYSVDVVESPRRARSAAQAYGAFCGALAHMDAGDLFELLPGFHDLSARLERLRLAAAAAPAERGRAVDAEVEMCLEENTLAHEIAALQAGLPRRVCHNDTKINNLLFDVRDHRPRAVIDLDTSMAGYWMHEYGDLVRTCCSAEPEDSTRLEHVGIREPVFAALCEGFLGSLKPHLETDERESLWLGARAICLMMAVRFLTDHLDGDRYFKATHPRQNLDRARNQLALYRDLHRRENALRPYLAR